MNVSANETWMGRLELNQENTARFCKTIQSLAVHLNARCFFAVLTAGRLKFPEGSKGRAGDKIAAALGVSGAYEKPDALYESPRDGEAARLLILMLSPAREAGFDACASDGNLS